ncbi:MAG: hypothetical protein JO100_12915 [Pseudonocardia sp.]|nr:hypothetical protein [Pseudonocardia sp.]
MARHGKPEKDSDKDGETQLDPASVAELVKEEGGRHSIDDEDVDDE